MAYPVMFYKTYKLYHRFEQLVDRLVKLLTTQSLASLSLLLSFKPYSPNKIYNAI